MNMGSELQKAIVDGVTGLMVLRLRGSPAADTVPSTAKIWIAAIAARPIAWDEKLDLPRIRAAFVELAATCDHWPSPAEFMRVLPPRIHQLKLTAPVDSRMSPETRELVDGVIRRLKRHGPEGLSQ